MKSENTERSVVEFVPFGTKDKIQLSIEIVKRLVAVKTKSGKTASDEDAFRFMLLCQARKLNPFEGDCYLIGYDSQHGASFSLITSHQAFLKRAELHPEFDGLESGTIVLRDAKITDLVGDWHMPNDKILGGWATVHFKNRKHPMTKRLRLERFNKNFGVWQQDPAGMIVKCAEADALRSSFPTMLGGMFVEQEMTQPGTDVPRPVFPATEVTTNGGASPAPQTIDQETETIVAVEREVAPAPPKKKPTLQRKAVRSSEKPRLATDREKLAGMLAVGNCTTDDFVKLAIDEGWIDLEQGTWEKIPDKRLSEFVQPENFELVMTMLDERRAKTTAAAAERGNLL